MVCTTYMVKQTKLTKQLADETRNYVLEGHEKYAYVERMQHNHLINFSEQNDLPTNSLNVIGYNVPMSANGYNVLQHPDFLKMDGLPSPFNFDPDDVVITMGSPILHANATEVDREKLALKLGLTSKYVLEEKPKYAPSITARTTFPRPRFG